MMVAALWGAAYLIGPPLLSAQGTSPPSLWLSLSNPSNNQITIVLQNTAPGSNYLLMTKPLLAGSWSNAATVTGASNQTWTAVSLPLGGQNSAFFEAMMPTTGATNNTNLWLALPANALATPGVLVVVLENTTPGQSYDVLTNLSLSNPAGWNVQQSVPGGAGNSTTVQVPLSGPVFFVRARVTQTGAPNIPAGWLVQNFGTTSVNLYTDANQDGLFNWQEYEYGNNPTVPGTFAVWVGTPNGSSIP